MKTINTKSVSMYELNQVPSEAQITKYIRRILFGKNLFCPICKSRLISKYGVRYRCRRCRHKFSLLSHTWLKDCKLSLQKLWLVLWCWTTQVPIRQTIALTQLSEKAIRLWFERFRTHLPWENEVLEHIVQLDEAYFKQLTLIMGKQQGTRKLAYEILCGTNPEKIHAAHFLQQYVKPRVKLRTDGGGIYKNIHEWWPVQHQVDIHRKFEFSLTSEIEGMFGVLRTFIRRMYHHSTPEKLPEIVREFCLRFSSPETFNSPLNYLQKSLSLVPTR